MAVSDIRTSLEIGVTVESDDPNLARIVGPLTSEQLDWIAAWLAGEGFVRGGY